MADANQVWPDQSNTVDMVDRGKILLYHSADSPHNVKITHVKPLWWISVKDISECPTIKAVIKQAAKDSLPMQTNSKLFFYVYHNDEQDWTRYGTYTQVMAFAEDEDIDAPWFRDPDGKNIVCVLATTFDIGTLFMAPSTTQPQSTSTHLHASTSSDANQESGLRTASASGNLSSDKERLIEYFGIPRHLIGTKNQGLRVNWEKYSACVTAINQAQHLYSAGKWPSNFPRYNQDLIIELIVGRSHWHGSYRLMRAVADHHPNMVHWLELEHSTPEEDKKAWGVSIPPITKIGWPELERYLRNHGTYPISRSQNPQPVASSSHHHQSPSPCHRSLSQSPSPHHYQSSSVMHHSQHRQSSSRSHSIHHNSHSHSHRRESPSPSHSHERPSKSSYKGKEPMRR
ncbi:hypothetical protein CPB84DRAFT_1856303 [Gymnopilus junonius]|uniref:Uncharacterized protein n=1 Tax=Gymnopilus junonius TaxID=109634 RepID=A0A9P5N6P6_GYMJU|nr:hypothetical protein CPB84DRAFT_1856303 [Gymnopilus junonius]